ncbi:methyltransferase domain-containing protein [Candidatus Woesearchaeota archaeon]|nr:methyltransferase domain-containing protein [Candidatus Woesearchaeota archaeon]
MFSEEDRRRQYAVLQQVLPTLNRHRHWESVSLFLGEQTSQSIHDTLASSSGRRVIDLGCGEGFAISDLAAMYPQHYFYGIDLFVTSHSPRTNLLLLQGDIQQLPFPQKTFDLVYSTLAFSYVSDKLRGLREAHRVLNSHGKGYIYTPPSLVSFVDKGLDELLPREKDLEWRADGRIYLQRRHSRQLFKPWEHLCIEGDDPSSGLVRSIYYKP